MRVSNVQKRKKKTWAEEETWVHSPIQVEQKRGSARKVRRAMILMLQLMEDLAFGLDMAHWKRRSYWHHYNMLTMLLPKACHEGGHDGDSAACLRRDDGAGGSSGCFAQEAV